MSKTTKIVLAILAGLVVMCLCVFAGMAILIPQMVKQAVTTDPGQVSEKSKKIAEFDIPAGYQSMAMSFMGFDLIVMTNNEGSQTAQIIMMMQFPPSANLSQEEMEAQFRQAMGQQMNRQNVQFQVLETSQTIIRGQMSTLVISEGTSQNGQAMRQAMASFPGNNGVAMVMYMSPANEWNQDALYEFLRSIR